MKANGEKLGAFVTIAATALLGMVLCGKVAVGQPAQAASERQQVPKWKPAEGPLLTRWAGDVSPDRAWPEYPRPQLVRRRHPHRHEILLIRCCWDRAR